MIPDGIDRVVHALLYDCKAVTFEARMDQTLISAWTRRPVLPLEIKTVHRLRLEGSILLESMRVSQMVRIRRKLLTEDRRPAGVSSTNGIGLDRGFCPQRSYVSGFRDSEASAACLTTVRWRRPGESSLPEAITCSGWLLEPFLREKADDVQRRKTLQSETNEQSVRAETVEPQRD